MWPHCRDDADSYGLFRFLESLLIHAYTRMLLKGFICLRNYCNANKSIRLWEIWAQSVGKQGELNWQHILTRYLPPFPANLFSRLRKIYVSALGPIHQPLTCQLQVNHMDVCPLGICIVLPIHRACLFSVKIFATHLMSCESPVLEHDLHFPPPLCNIPQGGFISNSKFIAETCYHNRLWNWRVLFIDQSYTQTFLCIREKIQHVKMIRRHNRVKHLTEMEREIFVSLSI